MKLARFSNVMPAAVLLTSAVLFSTAALAQDYPQQPPPEYYPQGQPSYSQPPPNFSPEQVDGLVARIALYPDPLLAQIFAAASFPDQIPEAAGWANQYRNLHGNQLADLIYRSNLPFDPAVQALLPFPAVLETMARDMAWTSALGNAVLADRPAIMDAVQRMRRQAEQYGYLQSNQQMRVVNSGPAVEILPVDPGLIYVPVYDPYVVYAPPRPGFFIGSAIGFGPCYSIGYFGGWGWGGGFNWYNHAVFVNHVAWGRTWYNRGAYIHNYGNWGGGTWRNYYNNRNLTIVNNRNYNSYSNGGNRGFQGGQNRAYGVYGGNNSYRNSGSYAAGNYGRQSAPAAPVTNNRAYGAYSGNGGYGNSYNRGSQAPAVLTPNGAYNSGRYSAPQPAAPANNRSYGNYNGYRNSGAYSQPSAPAVSNRSYGSANYNAYRSQGIYSQPSAPASRGFDRGGSSYRQSAPSGGFRSSAPAAAPQQNRGGGGGGGGRSEHGRR